MSGEVHSVNCSSVPVGQFRFNSTLRFSCRFSVLTAGWQRKPKPMLLSASRNSFRSGSKASAGNSSLARSRLAGRVMAVGRPFIGLRSGKRCRRSPRGQDRQRNITVGFCACPLEPGSRPQDTSSGKAPTAFRASSGVKTVRAGGVIGRVATMTPSTSPCA